MTSSRFRFDDWMVEFTDGDTVLVALQREGIHPGGGGCLCAAGDCPNCLAVVDGVAYTRTCLTPAAAGQLVQGQDLLHPPLAPAEPDTLLEPDTSGGTNALSGRGPRVSSRTDHTDVVVIGGGRSGQIAASKARADGRLVVVMDHATGQEAVGVYRGPMVVAHGPDGMRQVHCGQVIVATGARETQPACPGNDLIGLLTPRAAELLVASGVDLGLVVAVGDPPMIEGVQPVTGRLIRFEGRQDAPRLVGAVVVAEEDGSQTLHPCQTAIVGLGRQPRDLLARMGHGINATAVGGAAMAPTPQQVPTDGVVCRCSNVTVEDLESVRRRGFNEMDLVKRSTLAGTGTCQGAACMPHLQAWLDAGNERSARFTARPLARPLTMGQVAADYHPPVTRRTPLHDVHLALGARMERSGGWWRPWSYGEPDREHQPDREYWAVREYQAVRQGVSLGDVSTLGKFLVSGPDSAVFLDRLYPLPVSSMVPGRSRYVLLLNEGGYVMDDGMVCRQDTDRWFLTFTSAGGGTAEMWMRDWAAGWGMDVRIIDQTMSLAAINVTGPEATELMRRVGLGAPMAFADHRPATIAGVDCQVMRLSFTGEVSYEIHHRADQAEHLWEQLSSRGESLQLYPHGLDTLLTLRLEKGHILVGQDTEMDSTPARLDHGWAVRMDDGDRDFVGRAALERIAGVAPDKRLVGFTMDHNDAATLFEGDTVWADDTSIGHTTSLRYSPTLGHMVGLAWVRLDSDGNPPTAMRVAGTPIALTRPPFYDPDGRRARV